MPRKLNPDSRRAQAKAKTRAHILATAKALFLEKGYHSTTMRDVAKAAGMSTGAIFANWEGKDALYREIYGHDPVDAEAGRRAFILLRALVYAADIPAETVDVAASVGVVADEAQALLEAHDFPALPEEQRLDPDSYTLGDMARAAIDPAAAQDIRRDGEFDAGLQEKAGG